MNRVLVVESGAKTRTIRSFLGDDYDVVACGGHIMDLPDDQFGVDIEDDFAYSPEPIGRRGGNAVESVRSKLEDADEVYLATDPDREGEAIAADIRDHALPPDCRVQRIEFNAIVYPAVREALENPRDINENRVEAQRARRSLDRLIGFILSSITKFDSNGPGVPSVGRVQSPAVRLVVDREREIEEFESRKYWSIHAQIDEANDSFEGTLDGEWGEFADAKDVVGDLEEEGVFTVESCEVDPEHEQNPLPPYTTEALQNDADFLFNYSPERTMELAQELYEGVEIGDSEDDEDPETKALITYMRTDSTRVSPSALNLAKETLANREDLGEDMYQGRTWEAGEQAQDAHEAIRPTQPEEPGTWPENLEGKIDEPLLDLYRLIYQRFLASQMVPAIYRETVLDLTAGAHQAQAVGHELGERGFLEVWGDVRPGHQLDEVVLPDPSPGTELEIDRAWPEPEETQPPPRYREGSLVSELKDRGIGRPSTYGDILRKIKRNSGGFGYVRKSGSTLRPTEKGEALVDYLEAEFPRTVDYEYTARMESDLDQIEAGALEYAEFLRKEFEWLETPYRRAKENGWLDSEQPTPAQLEYLQNLSEETDIDVPEEVFKSKTATSEWIDKLREEIEPFVRLSDIQKADVNGIEVNRFRLYFNEPLPDSEYDYLKELGFQYKHGSSDSLPAMQFQRKDLEVVRDRWETVRDRYETDEVLEEFTVEITH